MSDIVSRLRAASFPACPDPDFDDASDPAVCDDAADEIELLRELLRKRDGGKLMHGPEENRRDLLDVLVEALDGADRVIVETWNALHEMDAHYLDAPELLRAITARAKQDLASWEDRDDDLSAPIAADFRSHGFFERYARALELVGNRHSKGALVALVAYLIKGQK